MPSSSHTPDSLDMMFHGLMEAHNNLISKMSRPSKTPLDPGAFLDEYQSSSGPTASFSLQADRPCLVEHIIVAYTPVAAATLTIGPASGQIRTIPIPATTTGVPFTISCHMIVKPTDVITLNCPGATETFVEVMGKVFSGTDWSQV